MVVMFFVFIFQKKMKKSVCLVYFFLFLVIYKIQKKTRNTKIGVFSIFKTLFQYCWHNGNLQILITSHKNTQ